MTYCPMTRRGAAVWLCKLMAPSRVAKSPLPVIWEKLSQIQVHFHGQEGQGIKGVDLICLLSSRSCGRMVTLLWG